MSSFRRIAIVSMAIVAGSMMVAAQSVQPPAQAGEAQNAPASVAPIAPDQQASKEQIAKLFEVMRIGDVQSMQSMAPSIVEQEIRSAMKQREEPRAGEKLTPEQRQRMQEVVNRYRTKAAELYAVDEMMADMRTIYQRYISKDDVNALIEFYSSPVGQRQLDARPMIAQEFGTVAMTKVAPRAEAMAKEMTKEMAAIAPAKPAAKTNMAKPEAK